MSSSLRICLLSVQTPAHVTGGMAEHTTFLARLLARHRQEVTLLTTRHPDGRRCETREGFEIRYLTESRPGSQRGGWWRASADAFDALHRERPFDVVLSQSTAASALVRPAARVDRPPMVALIHGTAPQMIASSGNAVRGGRGRLRALPRAARRIAAQTVNAWWVDRPVYRHAAAVVVVSEVVAASVRRWHPGAAERLRVVPYAVDDALFAPDGERRRRTRAALGVTDAEIVLLSAGVLTEQKGVHVAIEALARVRSRVAGLRLVVVGDGPSAAALRRFAAHRGVADTVRFVGGAPHDVMVDYYNAADVFVMPTLRVETFGLVLAEAMACEVPVVASRIGATAEVVDDGTTGVLVRPGDARALAEAIVALATAPARRAALGTAGRRRVQDRWAPDGHARAVLAVCRDALARR